MEYILVCPNAIVVKSKGLSISTYFTYSDKKDAEEHKKACDEWDRNLGKAPKSYIIEKAGA